MKILLWAKILKNNRLIKDYVLKVNDYSCEELGEYIKEICYNLDLETPVLLSKHFNFLEMYNMIKFSKDDFIDYVDFDFLQIEKSEK